LGIFQPFPLLVVRPFLRNPIWLKKKEEERSAAQRLWSCSIRNSGNGAANLLDDGLRVRGVFGMLQHFARIIPGGPEVRNWRTPSNKKLSASCKGPRNWEGYSAAS